MGIKWVRGGRLSYPAFVTKTLRVRSDGQLHDFGGRIHVLRRLLPVQLGYIIPDGTEPVDHGREPVVDHAAPNEQEHPLVGDEI